MRPLRNKGEIAVIGGGMAGLSAARHAARLGRSVVLFEGSGLFGGLVATIDQVDGLPAPGKFSGQDLAIALLEDVRHAAVEVIESPVASVELGARIAVVDEEGNTHRPRAVIVASGARLRKLEVPGEDALAGRGVSRCATCDGGFFRGADVVVVGGGDSALQEALLLCRTSRRVVMVCRGPLRAQRDYIDKLAAQENVSFVWNSEVTEVLGEGTVSGVRLRNLNDGTAPVIECAGVFPFIGVVPNTGFLPASLRTDAGLVEPGEGFATTDPRVFAVGAARAGYGGYVVQAMADGVGAATAAARLLH